MMDLRSTADLQHPCFLSAQDLAFIRAEIPDFDPNSAEAAAIRPKAFAQSDLTSLRKLSDIVRPICDAKEQIIAEALEAADQLRTYAAKNGWPERAVGSRFAASSDPAKVAADERARVAKLQDLLRKIQDCIEEREKKCLAKIQVLKKRYARVQKKLARKQRGRSGRTTIPSYTFFASKGLTSAAVNAAFETVADARAAIRKLHRYQEKLREAGILSWSNATGHASIYRVPVKRSGERCITTHPRHPTAPAPVRTPGGGSRPPYRGPIYPPSTGGRGVFGRAPSRPRTRSVRFTNRHARMTPEPGNQLMTLPTNTVFRGGGSGRSSPFSGSFSRPPTPAMVMEQYAQAAAATPDLPLGQFDRSAVDAGLDLLQSGSVTKWDQFDPIIAHELGPLLGPLRDHFASTRPATEVLAMLVARGDLQQDASGIWFLSTDGKVNYDRLNPRSNRQKAFFYNQAMVKGFA